MNYCSKCLERNWKFEKKENMILATCICGNEVMFEAKEKKKRKSLEEKDPCRGCGSKLEWRSRKLTLKRLHGAWHYCKWLQCVQCRAIYFREEDKVLMGQPCGCERVSAPKLNKAGKPVSIFELIAKI